VGLPQANRSKYPAVNLELSIALAKTISDLLVMSGVSPEDLSFKQLDSLDLPDSENELVEVAITKKEILE
tara:strand:+ start:204 stop:413 length:210 start_codon:yes stop_codon:yes gene_type:complete